MVRLSKDCLPRGPIQAHPTLTMLSLEGPQSIKHCPRDYRTLQSCMQLVDSI